MTELCIRTDIHRYMTMTVIKEFIFENWTEDLIYIRTYIHTYMVGNFTKCIYWIWIKMSHAKAIWYGLISDP